MNTVWPIFKLILWLVLFFLPFALIFGSFGVEARLVQKYTHLPEWASITISVVAAMLLTTIYVLLVWPRMLGINRKKTQEQGETGESRSEPCQEGPSSSQAS
jgi:hypothetical protein